MSLKESCSILPTISNYTGHFGHTTTRQAHLSTPPPTFPP